METPRCCLCEGTHTASDNSCPARGRELQIIEIIEKRHCSRTEAISLIKERDSGYAAVTARQSISLEATVSAAVATAIDKAIPIVMERLFNTFAEGLTEMLAARLNNLCNSFPVASATAGGLACSESVSYSENQMELVQNRPTVASSPSPVNAEPSNSFGEMRLGNVVNKRRSTPLSPSQSSLLKPKKGSTVDKQKQDVLRSAVESTILS